MQSQSCAARRLDIEDWVSCVKQNVLKLPGSPFPLRDLRSGYITVSLAHGRRLWYLLAEAEHNAAEKPVILWLTGGPGCSSIDAFTYENGPFRFTIKEGVAETQSADDVVLNPNPYSWTQAATMVWVDSPAGTGYSYSEVKRDYHTNDDRTIDDLYKFLTQLLTEYPNLQDRELYIAGESYAGVYVPLLAQQVVRNANHDRVSINLKGYIVGNPVTDDEYDGNGQVPFAYGQSLLDPITHDALQRACRGQYWNATRGSKCRSLLHDMEDSFGNLNIYSTLDACVLRHHDPEPAILWRQSREGADGSGWPTSPVLGNGTLSNFGAMLQHTIACADRRAALAYYNDERVRAALHAEPASKIGSWQPCSDNLHYQHTAGSMMPVHKALIHQGLRALVLSGDHDYVVPFTGTRDWVHALRLKEKHAWHTWSLGDKQVAGFAVAFEEGLTFATVKGAGHMVPQTNPKEALALLQRFLNKDL